MLNFRAYARRRSADRDHRFAAREQALEPVLPDVVAAEVAACSYHHHAAVRADRHPDRRRVATHRAVLVGSPPERHLPLHCYWAASCDDRFRDLRHVRHHGFVPASRYRLQAVCHCYNLEQRHFRCRCGDDRYGHHPQDGRHPQNNYPQDRLPQGRQQNGVNDVVINGVVGAAAGAAVDGRKGAIAGGAGAVAGKVIDNMGGGTGSVVGDTVVKGVVGAVIGGAIDGNKGAKAGAAGSVAGSVLDIFRNRENPNNR